MTICDASRSAYRPLLLLLAALTLLACGGEEQPAGEGAAGQQPGEESAEAGDASVEALAERARRLHEEVLALDTHVDIPFDFATGEHDPASADAQVNLRKMREGGLDAAFFIVYVGQGERDEQGHARALEDAITKFEAIHRMTDELYPDSIGLADSAEEVRSLNREGKLAAVIGVENGYVIGRDLSLLEDFRRRGARYMTLVHNGHNEIGDSAQPSGQLGDPQEEHGGLSSFGREVVVEMNRLGIMVDISHVSRQTMMEATELSRAPVIASHSAVAALTPHPRNMDDEQLRALADSGGVIQIVAFDPYLKEVPEARTEAIAELRQRTGIENAGDIEDMDLETRLVYEGELASIDSRWPPASVQDLADHIDYAVDLIGIEHVGISSDFGGGGGIEGWNSAEDTLNVTAALLSRGYSEEEVAMLWSGNFLRVMEEASRLAE